MDNSNNYNNNFKIQNSQRMREIENHLEREISGIVNKQKMFTNKDNRYAGMSENVSSKLKSFLDDRLTSKTNKEKGYNEEAYDNSLDYNINNNANNNLNNNQLRRDEYHDNYDDSYYNEEDEYYDDEYYEDESIRDSNPNSYLPFTYEEMQPEMPSSEELEKMFLNAMMPAIAQWLDLNIDRIVQKVVKDTLSTRGTPESRSSQYSKEYSATRGVESTREDASEREKRTRNQPAKEVDRRVRISVSSVRSSTPDQTASTSSLRGSPKVSAGVSQSVRNKKPQNNSRNIKHNSRNTTKR